MSNIRGAVRSAALIAIAAIGLATPVAARDVKLVYNHYSSADSPVGQAVIKLRTLLDERTGAATGGKIKLDYFDKHQLGNERENVDGLKAGTLDMADVSAAVLSNFVPSIAVVTLPYVFQSRAHAFAVVNSELGAGWAAEFDKNHGIQLLGFFAGSVRDLYTKRPINALDDVRGMKIRSAESPVFISFFRALGALPTPLPAGEIYTGLQSGVIDGTDVGAATYVTQKIYEQAPYVARMKFIYGLQGILVSNKSWMRLNEKQRAVLREAAKEASEFSIAAYEEFDKTLYGAEVKSGAVKVTEPDLEPFRKALEPVYESEWRPKYGQDVIKRIRAMAR